MHGFVHSGCLGARCAWWLQHQRGSQAGRGLFPNPLLGTCSVTWAVLLPSASCGHTLAMIQQAPCRAFLDHQVRDTSYFTLSYRARSLLEVRANNYS